MKPHLKTFPFLKPVRRWSAMKEAKKIGSGLISGYLIGGDVSDRYDEKKAIKIDSALKKLSQ